MIGIIVQARMNSTRLPGKVLMKLDELTVLDYVINQIRSATKCDKIVIATTNFPDDDKIVNHFANCDIDFFRGESENVLDRYYNCAKKFGIDPIIRITSDCPLIDPEILDNGITKFQNDKVDYISNNKPRTFPYGMDFEIFSFESLETTWENAKLPSEQEHVTPFIFNNPDKFSIGRIENSQNFSGIRITIDRINDLEVVRDIVSKIKERPILLKNLIKLYESIPEIFEKNKHYEVDEGLKKSIRNDVIKKNNSN